MDILKQAVARASKPFLDGVGEHLAHEFTAEERLELCGELEAFMAATIFLVRQIPDMGREGHEVIDEALWMTSPVLADTILEKAGAARDAGDGELIWHIHTFFTFASMIMMALGRGKEINMEEE